MLNETLHHFVRPLEIRCTHLRNFLCPFDRCIKTRSQRSTHDLVSITTAGMSASISSTTTFGWSGTVSVDRTISNGPSGCGILIYPSTTPTQKTTSSVSSTSWSSSGNSKTLGSSSGSSSWSGSSGSSSSPTFVAMMENPSPSINPEPLSAPLDSLRATLPQYLIIGGIILAIIIILTLITFWWKRRKRRQRFDFGSDDDGEALRRVRLGSLTSSRTSYSSKSSKDCRASSDNGTTPKRNGCRGSIDSMGTPRMESGDTTRVNTPDVGQREAKGMVMEHGEAGAFNGRCRTVEFDLEKQEI